MSIDVRTGKVLKTVPNARRIFCSRFGPYEFVQERKRYRIVGKHTLEIPSMSFPLHDAAISPEAICFSEAGIRCIELESGKQVWHHPDLWTNHLAFATADFNFYCVAMMHDPPNNCSLVRLAPRLMDCDQVAFVGLCWEAAFSQSGNFLVTMRGHVYETSTGRLLRQLGFPQRDYPDH